MAAVGLTKTVLLALFVVAIPFALVVALPLLERGLTGPVAWNGITLYDWQRIYELTALALVLALAACMPGTSPRMATAHGVGFVLITVGVGALSAWRNAVPWQDAAHEILLVCTLVAAFAALRPFVNRMGGAALAGMVVLCALLSALLYCAAFWDNNWEKVLMKAFSGAPLVFVSFSNVRFFSDYQAFLIPFLIYGAVRYCEHPFARRSAWAAIFVFCSLFYFSGSRVLVLGQLAAHACLLWTIGRRHLPVIKHHALAWLGGYFVYLLCAVLVPVMMGVESLEALPLVRSSLSLRDVLWQQAWRDVALSPLLGIGPGEFARQFNSVAAGPHNVVLMIAAEWGLPFLAMMAAAVLGTFRPAMQGLRQGRLAVDEPFAIACWLALLSLAAHALVANVAVIPSSQLCLLLAAVLASETVRRPEASAAPRQLTDYGCRVVLLALAASIIALLWWDVPTLPARNAAHLACGRPTQFFSPRFWQQGWLLNDCPAAVPGSR